MNHQITKSDLLIKECIMTTIIFVNVKLFMEHKLIRTFFRHNKRYCRLWELSYKQQDLGNIVSNIIYSSRENI